MDYYYQFELYKEMPKAHEKRPFHSQRIDSDKELLEIFRQNGRKYDEWSIIPKITRYDKKGRFVVVLEKGYDMGFEYYKFQGEEALKALKGKPFLGLHNETTRMTKLLMEGVYFSYATEDCAQYFARPWGSHHNRERENELVAEAETFLDSLKAKFRTESFEPYIYSKHSFAKWCDPFINGVQDAFKEQQL